MKISVCICSFRRPLLLSALLTQLGQQGLGQGIAAIEVVVVDNDPHNTAAQVVAAWTVPQGFSLLARHVPVPNIALARNAAVAAATGEWIAFVDDDEVPVQHWLRLLLACAQAHQADAVFGPVLPVYPPEVAPWIVQGRYFERRRLPTGTRITEQDARTGNALVRASSLSQVHGPFDAAFGRTGGEDSMLFRDLLARGAKFVWCDEAPVHEVVPVERANAQWLLRRSFRIGQTWIRAELYRLPRGQAWMHGAKLGGRALAQLVLSAGLALVFVPVSRTRSFAWLRIAAAQLGKLTGMSRLQFQEYAS
ncbi:glycosyltransferase family 2 protein [Rhodoferax aquaticus]|uniref:Glycosyltransferase n=1 Tax=Rhodoferax aquaticus TaxID=2527691 RepID=A0A515EL64_9BURK|nr:glycosyltransferase family 2 protein [Rhodoferax aquaticus]QDL53401.1 glycosyltransferase [Rhodoferax aquaticus]